MIFLIYKDPEQGNSFLGAAAIVGSIVSFLTLGATATAALIIASGITLVGLILYENFDDDAEKYTDNIIDAFKKPLINGGEVKVDKDKLPPVKVTPGKLTPKTDFDPQKANKLPTSQTTNRTFGNLLFNIFTGGELEYNAPAFGDGFTNIIKNENENSLKKWTQWQLESKVNMDPDTGVQTAPDSQNLWDLIVTLIPNNWGDMNGGMGFGFGTTGLMFQSDVFSQKSDVARSNNHQSNIPKKWKFNWFDKKPPTPVNPQPGNITIPPSLSNQNLTNILATPSPMKDDLLTFLGKCALYEGGVDHYKKYLKDKNYYKTAEFKIAGIDELMTGKDISQFPLYEPQELPIPNEIERQKVNMGIQHILHGLNEFPGMLPKGLLNIPQNKDPNDLTKPGEVVAGSAALVQAWFLKQFDQIVGEFPITIKQEKIDDKGEKTGEEEDQGFPNISTMLTGILGVAALGTKLIAKNLNLNQRNTGAINATMLNSQFANESINALNNCMGCSSAPTVQKSKTPTNTENPKNPSDLLRSANIRRQGVRDETDTSILEHLKKLQFQTNIIYNSVYKKRSDMDKELEKTEKLIKNIKEINEEKWEDFLKAINDEDNALNKNGLKTKITEIKDFTDPKNPYKNPIIDKSNNPT